MSNTFLFMKIKSSPSKILVRKALVRVLESDKHTKDIVSEENMVEELLIKLMSMGSEHFYAFPKYLENECALQPRIISKAIQKLMDHPDARQILGMNLIHLWLLFWIFDGMDYLRKRKDQQKYQHKRQAIADAFVCFFRFQKSNLRQLLGACCQAVGEGHEYIEDVYEHIFQGQEAEIQHVFFCEEEQLFLANQQKFMNPKIDELKDLITDYENISENFLLKIIFREIILAYIQQYPLGKTFLETTFSSLELRSDISQLKITYQKDSGPLSPQIVGLFQNIQQQKGGQYQALCDLKTKIFPFNIFEYQRLLKKSTYSQKFLKQRDLVIVIGIEDTLSSLQSSSNGKKYCKDDTILKFYSKSKLRKISRLQENIATRIQIADNICNARTVRMMIILSFELFLDNTYDGLIDICESIFSLIQDINMLKHIGIYIHNVPDHKIAQIPMLIKNKIGDIDRNNEKLVNFLTQTLINFKNEESVVSNIDTYIKDLTKQCNSIPTIHLKDSSSHLYEEINLIVNKIVRNDIQRIGKEISTNNYEKAHFYWSLLQRFINLHPNVSFLKEQQMNIVKSFQQKYSNQVKQCQQDIKTIENQFSEGKLQLFKKKVIDLTTSFSLLKNINILTIKIQSKQKYLLNLIENRFEKAYNSIIHHIENRRYSLINPYLSIISNLADLSKNFSIQIYTSLTKKENIMMKKLGQKANILLNSIICNNINGLKLQFIKQIFQDVQEIVKLYPLEKSTDIKVKLDNKARDLQQLGKRLIRFFQQSFYANEQITIAQLTSNKIIIQQLIKIDILSLSLNDEYQFSKKIILQKINYNAQIMILTIQKDSKFEQIDNKCVRMHKTLLLTFEYLKLIGIPQQFFKIVRSISSQISHHLKCQIQIILSLNLHLFQDNDNSLKIIEQNYKNMYSYVNLIGFSQQIQDQIEKFRSQIISKLMVPFQQFKQLQILQKRQYKYLPTIINNIKQLNIYALKVKAIISAKDYQRINGLDVIANLFKYFGNKIMIDTEKFLGQNIENTQNPLYLKDLVNSIFQICLQQQICQQFISEVNFNLHSKIIQIYSKMKEIKENINKKLNSQINIKMEMIEKISNYCHFYSEIEETFLNHDNLKIIGFQELNKICDAKKLNIVNDYEKAIREAITENDYTINFKNLQPYYDEIIGITSIEGKKLLYLITQRVKNNQKTILNNMGKALTEIKIASKRNNSINIDTIIDAYLHADTFQKEINYLYTEEQHKKQIQIQKYHIYNFEQKTIQAYKKKAKGILQQCKNYNLIEINQRIKTFGLLELLMEKMSQIAQSKKKIVKNGLNYCYQSRNNFKELQRFKGQMTIFIIKLFSVNKQEDFNTKEKSLKLLFQTLKKEIQSEINIHENFGPHFLIDDNLINYYRHTNKKTKKLLQQNIIRFLLQIKKLINTRLQKFKISKPGKFQSLLNMQYLHHDKVDQISETNLQLIQIQAKLQKMATKKCQQISLFLKNEDNSIFQQYKIEIGFLEIFIKYEGDFGKCDEYIKQIKYQFEDNEANSFYYKYEISQVEINQSLQSQQFCQKQQDIFEGQMGGQNRQIQSQKNTDEEEYRKIILLSQNELSIPISRIPADPDQYLINLNRQVDFNVQNSLYEASIQNSLTLSCLKQPTDASSINQAQSQIDPQVKFIEIKKTKKDLKIQKLNQWCFKNHHHIIQKVSKRRQKHIANYKTPLKLTSQREFIIQIQLGRLCFTNIANYKDDQECIKYIKKKRKIMDFIISLAFGISQLEQQEIYDADIQPRNNILNFIQYVNKLYDKFKIIDFDYAFVVNHKSLKNGDYFTSQLFRFMINQKQQLEQLIRYVFPSKNENRQLQIMKEVKKIVNLKKSTKKRANLLLKRLQRHMYQSHFEQFGIIVGELITDPSIKDDIKQKINQLIRKLKQERSYRTRWKMFAEEIIKLKQESQ